MPPVNRPAPQDHLPPATEREAVAEDFQWEYDGKIVFLPPANRIKAGVLRRAIKIEGDLAQIFAVVEEVADEESLAVIDEMELPEVGEMFRAWQRSAGASFPE